MSSKLNETVDTTEVGACISLLEKETKHATVGLVGCFVVMAILLVVVKPSLGSLWVVLFSMAWTAVALLRRENKCVARVEALKAIESYRAAERRTIA